jgi:signal transduction histidine kinase
MTLNASAEVLNNSREELSERNQMALDLLTDDIGRFTDLVEDLLEISRYDVGTAALHAEPIDLVEFMRQAVAHGRYPDTSVNVESLESLMIDADKRRLAQVVANLLDNAAKYGEGHVGIQLRERPDTVQIIVEDEGPGVPYEERSQIFDRFSRGSSGGRRGQGTGSGLGLSLVTEHVGLHGGHVWVEDRRDGHQGARFVVSLPKREADE